MIKKRLSLFSLTPVVALLLFTVALGSLQAQQEPDAAAADFELIADALVSPRGMAFSPDGELFIAEAGSGGAAPCIEIRGANFCYGETGAVTRVTFDADGQPDTQEQVITGLASLDEEIDGEDASGPSDVAFNDAGDLYLLMGLGADPAVRDPMGALGPAGMNFGQLVAVDELFNTTNVVDVSAYEAANNPDGAQIDSNPFGLLADGDTFKVADAGANDVLTISDVALNSLTADIATLAVFPARMVEFPPESGQMLPMDAVPTAVEKGPDGAYYVSQLTGFPFPVGGANIYRVVPGEDPEVYESGFTNVLDLAFGPDGSLYVLEMARDSLLAPPPIGRITQITPYGARTVLTLDELTAPVDMEIGPDYGLYVVNLGPSTSMGQVLRTSLPFSTQTIGAAKDNTLYENDNGALSNGQGTFFFAGATNVQSGFAVRRGVLAFDVNASIPEGSVILSAEVELNMSRAPSGDSVDVTLHTLNQDWGEGASDAAGEEGAGATAATNDATWLHTFYDTELWSAPGGDFDPAASASTAVSGLGKYGWTSSQLTADVQSWVDGATSNYGWLVMGSEDASPSAKRFDSRENPEADNRPKLIVEYIAPLPDYVAFTPVVRSAD